MCQNAFSSCFFCQEMQVKRPTLALKILNVFKRAFFDSKRLFCTMLIVGWKIDSRRMRHWVEREWTLTDTRVWLTSGNRSLRHVMWDRPVSKKKLVAGSDSGQVIAIRQSKNYHGCNAGGVPDKVKRKKTYFLTKAAGVSTNGQFDFKELLTSDTFISYTGHSGFFFKKRKSSIEPKEWL